MSARDDIAAVVLFGGHEIFCAGDDVPELRTLIASEADSIRPRPPRRQSRPSRRSPSRRWLPSPGTRWAAGLALALAADWRISGDNVKFGATEILAGLVPDGAGLARLARTVGASRAKELAYSGRFFDAEEALALGLVDDMVAPDGVYDAAVAWARRFVDVPPLAWPRPRPGSMTSRRWGRPSGPPPTGAASLRCSRPAERPPDTSPPRRKVLGAVTVVFYPVIS